MINTFLFPAFIITSLLTLTALVIAFGVNIAYYNRLKRDHHKLKTQLQKTELKLTEESIRLEERENQFQTLGDLHTSLELKYTNLQDRYSDLNQTLKGKEISNDNFYKQLQDIQQRFDQLEQTYKQIEQDHQKLQIEYKELESTHRERLSAFSAFEKNFDENKRTFKAEFSNLAQQLLDEKVSKFKQDSQESLGTLLQPLKSQIEQFQKRSNEIHAESVKNNTLLETEMKKVLDTGLSMSKEAQSLAVALKGEKKTLGNWGEMQLEHSLESSGLISGEHYTTQTAFKDNEGKTNIPDFVVNLPGNKQIIIDSKVSLIDYSHCANAVEESERKAALGAHIHAVKTHIDTLSKKDYANLKGVNSPSFVLMFMPIEPAYIEAIKHKQDLFNYGYNKNVILVSHTTLTPILRTVSNLWMVERSNEQAKAISAKAGDIYNQVCALAEHLYKLGNTLNSASNHYNRSIRALAGNQGLHKKVEHFSQLSTKANKSLPQFDPISADLEQSRLEILLDANTDTQEKDAQNKDTPKESSTEQATSTIE